MAEEKKKLAAPEGTGKNESMFSKEQLLAAEQFQGRRDSINALLSPDEQYTTEDVNKRIEKYMKGQVK